MQIISRKEAIAQGLSRYFTGEPCGHGHIDERYVSGRGCHTCRRIWYEQNILKYRANAQAWREAHPEHNRRYRAKLSLAYRVLRELGIEI